MDIMIKPESFLNNLFGLYDETFENQHGIYLDLLENSFLKQEAYHLGEIRQALCTRK